MPGPTIVGPEGEIVISPEIRKALGIRPGTRIVVTREGNRIIVELVNKGYVRSLRGCLTGGPSMTDSLLKERREEEARSSGEHSAQTCLERARLKSTFGGTLSPAAKIR